MHFQTILCAAPISCALLLSAAPIAADCAAAQTATGDRAAPPASPAPGTPGTPASPTTPAAPGSPAAPAVPKRGPQGAPAPGAKPAAPAPAPANTLTRREVADGWVLLFDGTNAGTHLRGFKKETHGDAWKVEDGCIVLRGAGGDLMTRDQWANFEFQVDWNVAPGGNSGIMYRVTEDGTYPWETGQEMQILDDTRHQDGKDRLTSAGACYALYAAPEGVVRPAGEWNTARVVAVGPKITYYLNGAKVVEFDMSTPEYKERVAKSKFASMPMYGTKPAGHIALQDHGDVVKFRNMKVRPLGADGQPSAPAVTPPARKRPIAPPPGT